MKRTAASATTRLRALGWSPQHPSYREGLRATLAEEGGIPPPPA